MKLSLILLFFFTLNDFVPHFSHEWPLCFLVFLFKLKDETNEKFKKVTWGMMALTEASSLMDHVRMLLLRA